MIVGLPPHSSGRSLSVDVAASMFSRVHRIELISPSISRATGLLPSVGTAVRWMFD